MRKKSTSCSTATPVRPVDCLVARTRHCSALGEKFRCSVLIAPVKNESCDIILFILEFTESTERSRHRRMRKCLLLRPSKVNELHVAKFQRNCANTRSVRQVRRARHDAVHPPDSPLLDGIRKRSWLDMLNPLTRHQLSDSTGLPRDDGNECDSAIVTLETPAFAGE